MFISIDGIDGVGKTSLALALERWFCAERKREVLLTKEPTSQSPWANEIRKAALSKRMPRTKEIEYFHKDRLWHLNNLIVPALNEGKVVISDRYVDSTLAYQARTPLEANALYEKMASEILIPDLTFILHCDVDTCLKRITQREHVVTSFERKPTLLAANAIFESRKNSHYRHIDSSSTFEETFSKACEYILEFVGVHEKKISNIRCQRDIIEPESSQLAFA